MAMHRDDPPDLDDRIQRPRSWRRCIEESTGFVDVDCVRRWRALKYPDQLV